MLKPRLVARTAVRASKTVIRDFESRVIVDEPNMTDRLAGAISAALDGNEIGGCVWRARTLRTGRGVAAEEKRHGADLLGVLEIDLPERQTKKGFLAQAKIAEPDRPLSPKEWKRFLGQCEIMLKRTKDAFGLIYSRKRGIIFIRAETLFEIGRDELFDAGGDTLHDFFVGHVKCQIGDRRLNTPKIEILDRMVHNAAASEALSEYGADTILNMKVTNA